MKDRNRTVEQAEQYAHEYAMKKTKDALGRVQMEMHGEGCGCPNCKQEAVKTANSWLNYMLKGDKDSLSEVQFSIEKGKIVMPKVWKRTGRV